MAVIFDGTNYIEIADSASVRTPSTEITIAYWLKDPRVTTTSFTGVITKWRSTSGPWVSYSSDLFDNSGEWGYTLSRGTDTTFANWVHEGEVPSDQWVFLVGRWTDGGPMNVRLYDTSGVLIRDNLSSPPNVSGAIAYNSQPLWFGRGNYGTPEHWTGELAGVYIHDTVLSDSEVDDLVADTVGVTAGGIGSPAITPSAGYWPLRDNANDFSGNDNHGTPQGDPVFTESPRNVTDWSSPAQDTTDASAPTGLIATAVSSSQINLSWDAFAGATAYDVERNGAVIAYGESTNSFSDTGLDPSTTYTYRVRAVLA